VGKFIWSKIKLLVNEKLTENVNHCNHTVWNFPCSGTARHSTQKLSQVCHVCGTMYGKLSKTEERKWASDSGAYLMQGDLGSH